MTEITSAFTTTREGLILSLFNRLGTAEGIVENDSYGHPAAIKSDRAKALDLVAEIVDAIDGKRSDKNLTVKFVGNDASL